MTILWPGDHRAGALFADAAVLRGMVRVERVWLHALVTLEIAPAEAGHELDDLVGADDLEGLAEAAEDGGNPVIALLALLRDRLATPAPLAARWLHRGLTSQDVLDTALVLCARDTVRQVLADCAAQVETLAGLADNYRHTPMVGRTLTQHAVPITFGAKAASWLHGVLDAADDLQALTFPGQFGGAAGTLSGATALTGDASRARQLATTACVELQLPYREPWHTARAPMTRIGAALVGASAAWGRIANDVLTLARPEIGELAEPAVEGRGGSSTMPQKANPVLSVLLRRTALAAPAHLTQLTLAAAEAHDERPAGAWHLEWAALQTLSRHTAAAAAQASELVGGLQIDVERMAANLAAARGVDAEQRSAVELNARHDVDGIGTIDLQIGAACTRARTWLDRQR